MIEAIQGTISEIETPEVTSEMIVKRWGIKPTGQQKLWPDPDMVLRKVPFQETGDHSFDRKVLIHWYMNVHHPDATNKDERTEYDIYQTWSNPLWKYFKYVKTDGYCLSTGQSCIQLACDQDAPVADHLHELGLWLPHVKPVLLPATDGYYRDEKSKQLGQYIKIFEHTLSQGACFSLAVFSPKDVRLCTLSYSHFTITPFDSLLKAVTYVHKHHWYERSKHEDDDG